jgi:hypothetical protein
MSLDHLSVEVNSDGHPFPSNQFDTAYEPDLSTLFDVDLLASDMDIVGVCESADLFGNRRKILIKINFYI